MHYKLERLAAVAIALSISVLISRSGAALAANSSEAPGGRIVFADMLYGLGIGLVLSGLTLVVTDDDDQVDRKLAAGSLAGATAGVGFGLYEILRAPAASTVAAAVMQPGWTTPRLAYVGTAERGGWGLGVGYVLR